MTRKRSNRVQTALERNRPIAARYRALRAGWAAAMSVGLLATSACAGQPVGGEAPETGSERFPSSSPASTPSTSIEPLQDPVDHLAALPVADGLSVAFFAEAGVEVDSQRQVLSWTDLVAGNRLEPSNSSPRLVPTGSGGHTAVEFGGPRTVLQMRDPEGLPVGPSDRTVVVAANWDSPRAWPQHDGFLGVGWGALEVPGSVYFQGSVLWSILGGFVGGVAQKTPPDGDPAAGAIAGCCKDFGFGADIFSPGSLMITSVVDEGHVSLFLGPREMKTSNEVWSLATVDDRLWLGGFPTREAVGEMDLSVVLVFDRPLSHVEIAEISDHLRTNYGIDQ